MDQPVSYMTPDGDFVASCSSAADQPDPRVIEAPDGGCHGMRWTGAEWIDDPEAEARAWAFLYGAPLPEAVTDEQLINAMGAEAWDRLSQIKGTLSFALRIAIDRRKVWGRADVEVAELAAVFQWTPEQADDLFRLAATK